MKEMMMKLWKDEEGATAIEYGMMIALISAVLVGTIVTMGTTLEGKFSDVLSAITGGTP